MASILSILVQSIPSADTFSNWMWSTENLFNPFWFRNVGQVGTMVSKIGALVMGPSLLLCLIFLGFEVAAHYAEPDPPMGRLIRLMVRSMIITGICVSAGLKTDVLVNGVLGPIQSLNRSIQTACTDDITREFFNGIRTQIDNENYSVFSMMSTIKDLPIIAFVQVASLLMMFIIVPIIHIYLSVMWWLLYCFGGLFLPFLIYRGVSDIGWNWVRTFLGYSLAGPLALIVTRMTIGSGFTASAVSLGGSGSLHASLVASIVTVLMLILVPSIALRLVGGTSANPFAVVMAAVATVQQVRRVAQSVVAPGPGTALAVAETAGSSAASLSSTGGGGGSSAIGAQVDSALGIGGGHGQNSGSSISGREATQGNPS